MVEQNQFWMEMVNKFMPKKEECNKKVENMKTKLKGKFSTEDNSMKERDQALKMLGEAHVKISSLHSRNEELERELNKFRLLNSQVADSKDREVENLDKTQEEAKEEEVESEEEKEDTTQGEKASGEEEDEEEEEEEEEISLGNTDSEQRHEFKSKMKHDRVTEPIDVGRELRSKKRHDRVADHSITGTKKELRLKKRHDRLTEPVKHQLRSQKNVVVVEKGKGKSPSSLVKVVNGKKRKTTNQDAQFDYRTGRRQPKAPKSK